MIANDIGEGLSAFSLLLVVNRGLAKANPGNGMPIAHVSGGPINWTNSWPRPYCGVINNVAPWGRWVTTPWDICQAEVISRLIERIVVGHILPLCVGPGGWGHSLDDVIKFGWMLLKIINFIEQEKCRGWDGNWIFWGLRLGNVLLGILRGLKKLIWGWIVFNMQWNDPQKKVRILIFNVKV